MTGGRRVSKTLFSSRAWKKTSSACLSELLDLLAKVEQDQDDRKVLADMPEKGRSMPAEEIVDREEAHTREEEPESLVPSTPEGDAILQEWCLLPEVSLPFAYLDASDGRVKLLTVGEMEELKIISNPGT